MLRRISKLPPRHALCNLAGAIGLIMLLNYSAGHAQNGSQPLTIKVEASTQEAKRISGTPPLYPAMARAAHIEGTVKLWATIGPDGLVKSLQSMSGPPLLIQSALQAVKQWKYQQTIVNGSPVAVVTEVDVNFTPALAAAAANAAALAARQALPTEEEQKALSPEQLQKEAKAHRDVLWSKILNNCGDSYYYTGSGLDNRSATGTPFAFSNGPQSNAVEYQNVKFDVLPPPPLTPAEERNAADTGTQDAGSAILLSTLYRTGNTIARTWGGWIDGPLSKVSAEARANPAAIGAAVANVFTQITGFAGTGGSLTVHMQRKRGEWYYTFGGVMSYLSRNERDLMANDGAPIHRLSCTDAQLMKPNGQ